LKKLKLWNDKLQPTDAMISSADKSLEVMAIVSGTVLAIVFGFTAIIIDKLGKTVLEGLISYLLVITFIFHFAVIFASVRILLERTKKYKVMYASALSWIFLVSMILIIVLIISLIYILINAQPNQI
jgi:hypothetical protein